MAAAWPLSAIAGILPASLSLALLLATPAPPPPPPPPPPQILLPPRRGAHAVSPSRAQVSILVLGAAAVFFEHIRKIGCMHS
jgi:dolichyl-phosphate beta-glucosyltransferase